MERNKGLRVVGAICLFGLTACEKPQNAAPEDGPLSVVASCSPGHDYGRRRLGMHADLAIRFIDPRLNPQKGVKIYIAGERAGDPLEIHYAAVPNNETPIKIFHDLHDQVQIFGKPPIVLQEGSEVEVSVYEAQVPPGDAQEEENPDLTVIKPQEAELIARQVVKINCHEK